MSNLVIAEHNHSDLNASTLSVVAAASAIGGETTVLVAGNGISSVVEQAQAVDGVSAVIGIDSDSLAHLLPETLAQLVNANADGFSHILAPATTFGKNFLPRVAAKL
ncbi:MAG: electron transfer flavoprotein subunit alpha/FixB family protein, partial [Kangiellaceae bacterium]|nr:electron transfer flavoprotein subunit alpha/FixB family protein [Kangiellaceae bacterium]